MMPYVQFTPKSLGRERWTHTGSPTDSGYEPTGAGCDTEEVVQMTAALAAAAEDNTQIDGELLSHGEESSGALLH